MSRSINPMCSFVRPQGETYHGFAPVPLIVWMSLRPAIPWRVALLHSSPPLYRPESILNPPAETVNHHLSGAEEFSTGDLGNFQPALTNSKKASRSRRSKRATFSKSRFSSIELLLGDPKHSPPSARYAGGSGPACGAPRGKFRIGWAN